MGEEVDEDTLVPLRMKLTLGILHKTLKEGRVKH
jgi:hypothetical protein